MATALITAIIGQDGSYMAGLLKAKGYRVMGAVRYIRGVKKSLLSELL
jgi:GDP-D-mannose dehydratase